MPSSFERIRRTVATAERSGRFAATTTHEGALPLQEARRPSTVASRARTTWPRGREGRTDLVAKRALLDADADGQGVARHVGRSGSSSLPSTHQRPAVELVLLLRRRHRGRQSPRRPNTNGTVRRRIFTSSHSDQLAPYR